MFTYLGRAWAALRRYPLLVLVPIGWDAVTFWAGRLLDAEPTAKGGFRVLPPPALPTGISVLGGTNFDFPSKFSLLALLTVLGALVAGALVKAGFLHLLTGALEGVAPSRARFLEGAERFGGRIIGWQLLAVSVGTGGLTMLGMLGVSGMILAVLVLVAGVILFYLVEFLLVAEDRELIETVRTAPGRLFLHFSALLPVLLMAMAVSGLLSVGLSALSLGRLAVASPLWALFGTWGALGVLSVLKAPKHEW